MFSTGFTSFSVFTSFSSIDHHLLCTQFFDAFLSNLHEFLSFNPSASVLFLFGDFNIHHHDFVVIMLFSQFPLAFPQTQRGCPFSLLSL